MWRYNDEGVKGKIFCKGVMNDIAKTEADISKVNEAYSQSQAKLNECEASKYEEKIAILMLMYEYFKIETYIMREKLASIRMK